MGRAFFVTRESCISESHQFVQHRWGFQKEVLPILSNVKCIYRAYIKSTLITEDALRASAHPMKHLGTYW